MNQKLNKEVGKRLRAQREYLNLTREKFCEIVDVSPQFLSQVERGIKGPSVEKLLTMCDGLGLSTDYVLRGKDGSEDIPLIVAVLSTLDKEYIPLAEDILKTFFKAIAMKTDKE